MEDFFSKPLDHLEANDIKNLIDTPEGQLFEIKSELPAEEGKNDPWYQIPAPGKSRKSPGDYAKQNIFKEVVAFANSEGGWLVLGLTETSDHPKRVKGIKTLPDCHELADRLKRAAYEWVDPPLPSLQCLGIEIGKTTGEGVIVFRVPRSIDAPHRLNKSKRTQEAYKRVGDESKTMEMREIQGITLDMARGQERVDREFNNARDRYRLLKPKRVTETGRRLLGFYIALLPLSGPLTIDLPYLDESLFERKNGIEGISSRGDKVNLNTINTRLQGSTSIQPILRGGRKTWTYADRRPSDIKTIDQDTITVEIYESGTIQ